MNNLIIPEKGTLQFSIRKTAWLYLMLIPCVYIDYSLISLHIALIGLALTFITVCLGHSIGLHRGVIHKSYSTSTGVLNVLMYIFVFTGLGGPLSWLKLHYYRDYWQNQKYCPEYFAYDHPLWKDYFWNLHLSFKPKEIYHFNIPDNDLSNRWYVWLEKTWWAHHLLFAVLLFVVFDLNTMLFLICFRSSLVILGHWYIGYASHKFGYSHYKINGAKESAFNDVLLGFLSFGEGYHNNHHAHPTSAKFGVKWYEFDLGWQVIKVLKALKIIWNVKNHTVDNTLKKSAIKRQKTVIKFPIVNVKK